MSTNRIIVPDDDSDDFVQYLTQIAIEVPDIEDVSDQISNIEIVNWVFDQYSPYRATVLVCLILLFLSLCMIVITNLCWRYYKSDIEKLTSQISKKTN